MQRSASRVRPRMGGLYSQVYSRHGQGLHKVSALVRIRDLNSYLRITVVSNRQPETEARGLSRSRFQTESVEDVSEFESRAPALLFAER